MRKEKSPNRSRHTLDACAYAVTRRLNEPRSLVIGQIKQVQVLAYEYTRNILRVANISVPTRELPKKRSTLKVCVATTLFKVYMLRLNI